MLVIKNTLNLFFILFEQQRKINRNIFRKNHILRLWNIWMLFGILNCKSAIIKIRIMKIFKKHFFAFWNLAI